MKNMTEFERGEADVNVRFNDDEFSDKQRTYYRR